MVLTRTTPNGVMGPDMELKAFLSPMSPEQREAFADLCGSSAGHLRNICYGKSCAPALAVAIEKLSDGLVTRKELRDDWRDIWPELDTEQRVRA
jgi:DNA-binding transcriptional regulator YdaS (Cro superfamily)